MQTHGTTRTAALLLAVAMVMAGCGARATVPVGSPTDRSPTTPAPTETSTTSTTIADATPGGEAAESAGQEAAPPTTTTGEAAVTEQAVDDIDSMIEGLDETLAELDQLLNQAAAALVAEEGEILP
jgi:hypothetical protein